MTDKKIVRPKNSYFLYKQNAFGIKKQEKPDLKFGELMKEITEEWHQLAAEEKDHWNELAKEDKLRYEREMAGEPAPNDVKAPEKVQEETKAEKPKPKRGGKKKATPVEQETTVEPVKEIAEPILQLAKQVITTVYEPKKQEEPAVSEDAKTQEKPKTPVAAKPKRGAKKKPPTPAKVPVPEPVVEEEPEPVVEAPVVAAPAKKSPAKKAAKATGKDGAPKKPLGLYFIYLNQCRAKVKEDNPDLAFKELNQKLTANWKILTDDEKAVFQKILDKDKERYTKEMIEFNNTGKFTPVSMADASTDDN